MRNDDVLWDAAAIELVLIGDSYVQGACVGAGQTIADQLASPSRTVINLGTSGNNPIQYAALAEAFLPTLAPRYAAMVFYANDNNVGCKPIFVYIPNSEFWRPDPRADAYRQTLQDYIRLRYPAARLIDTSADIAGHGPAAYASQGPHLSALGYSVVAQALLRQITP